jgi:hypothetical protein
MVSVQRRMIHYWERYFIIKFKTTSLPRKKIYFGVVSAAVPTQSNTDVAYELHATYKIANAVLVLSFVRPICVATRLIVAKSQRSSIAT